MSYYAAFLISTFIALILTPALMRHAVSIGVIDEPNERKVHNSAIPRIGGVAMVLATIVPLILWLPLEVPYIAICSSILVIFIFGFWDDRKELSYKIKFSGQMLAASIVVIGGKIYIKELPLPEYINLGTPLLYGLTIFFLVGITNAMNMTDGLDGLAGGITLLSFCVIAVLSIGSDSPYVLLITVAVVGGVLGFLRFNSHPAIVFMGDTGSQFLGFVLGLEAIMLTQFDGDYSFSQSLPLLILGLPLLDTLLVILVRIKQGKSPFHADNNHIHHRLLKLGLNHYQAVATLYLMQTVFVLSAYYMAYSEDMLPFYVFCFYGFVIVAIFWLIENSKITLLHYVPYSYFKKNSVLIVRNIPLKAIVSAPVPAVICTIVVLSVLVNPDVSSRLSPDIAALSLLLLLSSFYFFFVRYGDTYYRVIFATFSALLVYLAPHFGESNTFSLYGIFEFTIFFSLVIWLALNVYIGDVGSFKTNPFDILIILVLLVMPFLIDVGDEIKSYVLMLVKFIIILYSFELLISKNELKHLAKYHYLLAISSLLIFFKYLLVSS